ncbi:Ferrienterobactin-binding periplasmic protein precursor [Vibrio ruber DSM 16370]|uniref:Ferrienterobactin-binding periplasmic protein n=1 Tax=Vibrio ruber (strain DSM 16370 / JCM 11486 / BCRC 17186 / CECT 7878 / LMG 23124 / VR1) TaxID=1123498 RepID=A0A1R4LTD9_VIBR1|nr:Fe2+-enterobactin ABC transporter substrate-binding protein [Vibrio ruber]SJN59723.1 Ferrienterobactin-binding periplasmic protein precursor [Vibrio ruber DSM 16370]
MPRVLLLLVGIMFAILIAGCNDNTENTPNPSETSLMVSQGWPKTISNRYGKVTLNKPPQRIVSTSVSITGTLLAIDAPLIASGGTRPDTLVADKHGFFFQWNQVAYDRGVKPLYQGVASAEAVAKEKPDLIIVSATGGDSAVKLYQQFSTIAPTLVINYDDKSWQTLARLLGSVTDRTQQAESAITRFDTRLLALKDRISLPPQPVSAMVYYGDNRGGNFWTDDSAQGQILNGLGFTLSPLPDDLKNNHQMGKRKDIVPVNGEKFADAITGRSVLLFAADATVVGQVKHNKFIAHLPAIRQGNIFAMGNDSFRLDYYSAMNLLTTLETTFSRSNVAG